MKFFKSVVKGKNSNNSYSGNITGPLYHQWFIKSYHIMTPLVNYALSVLEPTTHICNVCHPETGKLDIETCSMILEHYLPFSLQYQDNVGHKNSMICNLLKIITKWVVSNQCYLYYSELQTMQCNHITDWLVYLLITLVRNRIRI